MSVLSGAYYAFTTDNDRNDKKEKLLKKEFLFRKIAFCFNRNVYLCLPQFFY